MKRRHFFMGATAAAASAQKVIGANDRVILGLIGCGGRGRYVGGFMKQAENVEFAAAADVYLPHAERTKQWAGAQVSVCQDFRKLLEQKDIAAVLVATPDHWHATATVLACQAGKDVYVEKPIMHNIREGRKMVNASRRYNRIVMAGTQQRSAPHYKEVQRIVQSGELGRVHFVRVWNYTNMSPNGIGREPDGPVPEGLDWDFFVGPAPKVPFNRRRFSSFRWFRDYAGGYITDFGTHRLDTVHQIMGVSAPRAVASAGRRFRIDDAGDIPDVLQVSYEYETFVLSYEGILVSGHGLGGRTPGMRYYNSRGEFDRPHGEAYYGTNGSIFCDRIGYEVFPDSRPEGKPAARFQMNTTDATSIHAKSFIDHVRSRKQPEADIEVGVRSTTVALLGNVARDCGRRIQWDAEKETIVGDPKAAQLLGRTPRQPYNWI